MSDPRAALTAEQIADAGIDDWRLIEGTIQARFATGNFAAGLALVNQIGEAAEAANHHPDITLTYPSVLVVLSSHDVGAITARDIDLARTISGFAASAGILA